MIHRLELENYRSFKHYSLSNLARVNLLVGKNNSGKTSILEAVQLLGFGGDLRGLAGLARSRGELVLGDSEETESRPRRYSDVSHFFSGHSFGKGSSFTIDSGGGLGRLQVVITSDFGADDRGLGITNDDVVADSDMRVGAIYRRPGSPLVVPIMSVPVSDYGAVLFDRLNPHYRFRSESGHAPPVRFLPQDSLNRGSMSEMWDKVTLDGKEEDVVDAMRILDPKISSIVFQSMDRSPVFDARFGIILGFEGQPRRHPIGSYGEGMRRILALALSLTMSKNGVLLVDEIDTGLHYSIIEDVWLLILETAKRLDLQVFATTHSFDCLRSLARLCARRPDLATEISVQKIERELDEAVAFDAEQIQIAVEQEIEVR